MIYTLQIDGDFNGTFSTYEDAIEQAKRIAKNGHNVIVHKLVPMAHYVPSFVTSFEKVEA